MKLLYGLISLFLISLPLSALTVKNMEFVSEFGGKGEAIGKFSDKTSITFDSDSNAYILDEENLKVQKFDYEGKPIFEIVSDENPLFINPKNIAVDKNKNIYVVDWNMVHIEGTDSPKIFNYGVCVHKFSKDGKFLSTFTVGDLTKKPLQDGKAVPAIDTDGNFALLITKPETDRRLYICVDGSENIYVLDQDKIYKLDSSGQLIKVFGEHGDGKGQMDSATGLTADSKGNIYVADSGNNRLLKFNSDGEFINSFGKKGEGNGCFLGKLYIISTSDNNILVADSAKYKKVFKANIQHRNIDNSTVVVTGQDDTLITQKRQYESEIRRFQKFDENGKFVEKYLYRIDKTDPELRDLEFKAIDSNGNLYLVDKDRLVIRKYSVEKNIKLSSFDKLFTFRVLNNESRTEIDNPYDLNNYFDFDERQKYFQMTGIIRAGYDITESLRFSASTYLIRLNGETTDKYPGDDGRGYVQDDITMDKYTSGRFRIDLDLILNHDPFEYRTAKLFGYIGGGRYNYDIDAIDTNNQRNLKEKLWWYIWALGARYDLGENMRLSFIASHYRPMDFMNFDYTYIDEEGVLYSTGHYSGDSTQVFIVIDGAF
ncbi:MAG: NHL repeat-containing protein [Candidatus Poribacteria bacterium]